MIDFKIKINNFGPINKADLNISKINIVSGENASGKTTISKLLFSILAAFSTEAKHLTYESMKDRLNTLIKDCLILIPHTKRDGILEILNIKRMLDKNFDFESIKESFDNLKSLDDFENKKYLLNMVEKTLEGLLSPRDLLFNILSNEFGGDGEIIDNLDKSTINVKSPFECNINGAVNVLIKNLTSCDVIYIETPYFLDYSQSLFYHQSLLFDKLKDSPVNDDAQVDFQNKINNLINGTFVKNSGVFKFKQNGKTFDFKNTSHDLKLIGILQILLENGKLKENTFLIMDEAEVHLHPRMQVKLAQILVLLVKDLNITLFINSHSPVFIEAIEVFSVKYALRDYTNFYLTEIDKDTQKFNVEKIGYDEIYKIYNNLRSL